jgi:hypothetical protein
LPEGAKRSYEFLQDDIRLKYWTMDDYESKPHLFLPMKKHSSAQIEVDCKAIDIQN